jgi:hypothetical protein
MGMEKIKLNRYSEGWNPLPTKKVGEGKDYIYYSAETPGFSIFAITGEKEALEITPVVTPALTPTTLPEEVPSPLPTPREKPNIPLLIGIVAFITILCIILYFVSLKMKKKTE